MLYRLSVFQNANKNNGAILTPRDKNSRASSVAPFSKAFLLQDIISDGVRQPLADITADNQQTGKAERKRKRARLLLDSRTELTDEELKVSVLFLHEVLTEEM